MHALDTAYLRALNPKRIRNAVINLLSYYVSSLTRRAWTAGLPIVLSIEPTNICNLKCPQCPSGRQTLNRPKGYMDLQLYKSILHELRDSVTQVQFFFQGEPFLHKKLPEMISIAHDKKMYTSVSTNGHYLTEEIIHRVLDSGLDLLIISLDGITQDKYSEYRKNGNLDKVLSGLNRLKEIKRAKNCKKPQIHLQFLILKSNENDIDAVRKLGREIGVDRVNLKTAQVYSDTNWEEYLPANEKYSRYRIKDGNPVLKASVPDRCRRIWTNAVITWDGLIAACCFDKDAEQSFGRYEQGNFAEIWLGETGMNFRNAVLNGRKQIPMCTNCHEGIKEYIS